MNQNAYNELITKTFRDNAIRSVLMIDDDYLTYETILQSQEKGETEKLFSQGLKVKTSQKAAEMRAFFSDKNLICDISDGGENFNPETARKSDLLILDYELEKNNPTESLNILSQLANSKHMNVVVIYTNKELEYVWLETLASLTSGYTDKVNQLVNSDSEFEDFWEDSTKEGTVVPDLWNPSLEDVSKFLLQGDYSSSQGAIARSVEVQFKKYAATASQTLMNFIAASFDKLKKPVVEYQNLQGSFSEQKWLLIGNLFIVYHQKSEDDEPQKIWDTIENSLHHWSPNYFRLIASEIQNHVENDGLVFSKYLKENYLTQAAWLWHLLKNNATENNIEQFLRNEIDSNVENVILNQEIISFARDTLATFDDFPTTSLDSQKSYALERITSKEELQGETVLSVAKSLNYSLSVKNSMPHHITNGLLLHCEPEGRWFLCVSPACDTVPEQHTSKLSEALSPFRMLKFIELSLSNMKEALKNAHHGRSIFLPHQTQALEVANKVQLQYAVCHEHDTRKDQNHNYTVSFFEQKEGALTHKDMELKAVAQLKDSYAARFQAIASSHVGRVGVDFISFELEAD